VKYGKPEIMNTDQGSQYTGSGWITTLTEPKIKIPPSVCMQTPAGNRWAGAAICPEKQEYFIKHNSKSAKLCK
jgi:hypothetical protein